MKNLTLFLFISTILNTKALFAKDLISITAVGDVMMGTTYPIPQLPELNKNLFEPAKEWISASDIRFLNFEGTFFNGDPQPDGKKPGKNRYLFQTPPEYISQITDADFNVVSLANNHVNDFGSAGIRSTKQTFQNANIQYSSKSGEVAEFQVDETAVSLIAVDYYRPPRSIIEPLSIYQEIQKLNSENKLIIISAHAGGEGSRAQWIPQGAEIFLGENRGDSVSFARNSIDAGADVIIMHGPHVPRGIEIYKNKIIIYSLGNFMTGIGVSLAGASKLAPLVRLQIDKSGDFKQGQIVSFVQKRDPQRLVLDLQHTAFKLMEQLSNEQFFNSQIKFEKNGVFRP